MTCKDYEQANRERLSMQLELCHLLSRVDNLLPLARKVGQSADTPEFLNMVRELQQASFKAHRVLGLYE